MSKIFEYTSKKAEEAGLKFGRLERTLLHNGTLAHFWTQYEDEPRVLHYGYNSILNEVERASNGGLLEEELEEYVEPEIQEYDRVLEEVR